MIVLERSIAVGSGIVVLGLIFSGMSWATSSREVPHGSLVQMPYEVPTQPEYQEPEAATPAPEQLSEQEKARLDALVPLLAGKQEFWAMGEFVHYGKHSVPYLIKALSLPGDRVRYNAVETMAMIKDPASVPALLERAVDTKEVPRVRAHAIRVATRIDPLQVVPAIAEMVKDENSTIRSTAVFEARHVPLKEILPIIIGVIPDPEQYVAITARDSFWVLTKFGGQIHDWEISTPEDRKQWVQEWWDWWEEFKKNSQQAPNSEQVPTPPANLNVS
ncbi:MAG: HEAT repeat domain-containing protein [Nitrospirales bacterium]|nr:HEAT repeat domain-containing protein [Nitrospirales bacterium]